MSEGFFERWSRRKQQERAPEAPAPIVPAAPEPSSPVAAQAPTVPAHAPEKAADDAAPPLPTLADAQAWAADHGIALVFPDTSPRGEGVANDDAYDLGQGASFYVNATEQPWARHFRMWDYIADELPAIIEALLQDGYTFEPISAQILTGNYILDHSGKQCPVTP